MPNIISNPQPILKGGVVFLAKGFKYEVVLSNSDVDQIEYCEIFKETDFLHTAEFTRYIVVIGEGENKRKFFLLDHKRGETLEEPDGVFYTYWLQMRPYETGKENYFALLACIPASKSLGG
jgi:hypothetical protein